MEAKPKKTVKNEAGQRLGHQAAELKQLRTVVNAMRDEQARRDKLITDALDRLVKAHEEQRIAITTFLGTHYEHQNAQLDHTLQGVISACRDVADIVLERYPNPDRTTLPDRRPGRSRPVSMPPDTGRS